MRFLYLRDPLFLVCLVTYFVNRFVFKRIWTGGFVHEHFNDVLCIPFWVPIMLTCQHLCGLRKSTEPPTAMEIVIPLVIWSWVFEIYLPATIWFGDRCVADYRDVVAYSAGGLAAAIVWRWWYRENDRGQPKVGAMLSGVSREGSRPSEYLSACHLISRKITRFATREPHREDGQSGGDARPA